MVGQLKVVFDVTNDSNTMSLGVYLSRFWFATSSRMGSRLDSEVDKSEEEAKAKG